MKESAVTIPDGVYPVVMALLARWGIEVKTVRHLDATARRIDRVMGGQIDAIAAEHDLTIVLGFLGSDQELSALRGKNDENAIKEPTVAPAQPGLDGTYSRDVGLYRPADIARISSGAEGTGDQAVPRCKLVMALRGLPLPVFTAMYTMVKPALDALAGVGAYPVQHAAKYNFFSPQRRDGFSPDSRAALLSRPEAGMSRRHGVRWLTGVLASPAPRDGLRHWLQLARLTMGDEGRMALDVLPSEEYQVRGLIGAEAMVAIEKGDGMLPAGTVVQYFMLD